MKAIVVTFFALAVGLLPDLSNAAVQPPGTGFAECNEGGRVIERVPPGKMARFDIFLTDGNRNIIGGVPFTTVTGNTVTVNVPPGRARLANGGVVDVCD